MKLCCFVSACLMILASSALSQAEISQHFDRSGRLVSEGVKRSSPPVQKMRRYSVPEGIELLPGVRYEFYPVFGKTFAEIVKSTEENSPKNNKTKIRQLSEFTWELGWTYDFSFSLEPDEEDETVHCDIMIIDPVLSYDITVTLPALTDDSALNPMEKNLWKNYVAALLERMHGRIKLIRDDARDEILRQLGEIGYLALSDKEAENAEKLVERFVRTETEKLGSSTIRQIQQKLEAFDSGTVQEVDVKPVKAPSRRITR